MPVRPEFVAFAVDLLDAVGPVQARRMFGGYGLYARGVMFGILDDDELFLKTDEASRQAFRQAGCRNWVYPGGPGETSYWRPPDEAHEEAEAMAPWARLGLEAALRLQAAKAARARGRGRGKKAPAAKAKASRPKPEAKAAPRPPAKRKPAARKRSGR